MIRKLRVRLRHLSKSNSLHIGVALLCVVWITGYFGAAELKKSNKNKLVTVRTELQKDVEHIISLPSPKKIEKGQLDTALHYIIKQSETITSDPAPKAPSHALMRLSHPFDRQWVDLLSQLEASNNITHERNKLLIHHANVLETIRSVVSYNPQADLSFEGLSDAQINERIDAAKIGLGRANDALQGTQPYSASDDIDGLIGIINGLQDDLRQFEQTRDKAAWYESVVSAQDKIIANRQLFWETESETLLRHYAETSQKLSELVLKL